ncbi:L,D-transpeptidase [Demequina sp.]|uniref:L,D-transpeptidase n=1 Tax=Demequina sp. TaxID=2050685 RepID=UPI003D0B537F
MRLRGLRAAVGTLVVLAALTACTQSAEPTSQAPSPTPSATASDTPTIEASPQPTADEFVSTVAYVKGQEIKVSDTPGGDTTMTVKATDVLTVPDQTPLVLLTKTIQADAIEVYLPIRPNGSTGWIDPADVDLYETTFQLDVYHADHTMTLSQEGVVVATYPIATGQDEMPTPGGVYFIRELLAQPDPNGAYGPYAYGLSGYSPVLDTYKDGDAVIGIHGTNDPSSIGKDISHGCIRMHNADITELVQTWQLPLGVPVYIHE